MRPLGCFFKKESDVKPHKVVYWLHPKCSAEELAEGSKRICEVYKQAPILQEQGIKTLSVDEKTGIQALERNAGDLPMQVGKPEKHEVEYIRHGTQCLIAKSMFRNYFVKI